MNLTNEEIKFILVHVGIAMRSRTLADEHRTTMGRAPINGPRLEFLGNLARKLKGGPDVLGSSLEESAQEPCPSA